MSTFKTHDGGDDAQIESGSGQLKAAGASGQGKVMGPSTSQKCQIHSRSRERERRQRLSNKSTMTGILQKSCWTSIASYQVSKQELHNQEGQLPLR